MHIPTVRAEEPRLDALCLNAGRGGAAGDPREVTVDGREAVMQVNALSHHLLTAELLPLLLASPGPGPARVCFHSSSARFNAEPADLDDPDHAAGHSVGMCNRLL